MSLIKRQVIKITKENNEEFEVKGEEGKTLIQIPLTLGVVGAILLPVWAAIGAIAAVVTRATISVERE
ncbi:MAG: DUF4342 domain-containing protein [Actinobacteria bacterium]|nr:DUF4342 domain-containing protein [Actinomycetota bacterium]